MIIIRYSGGLGNQMFQYAFHVLLETRFNRNDIKADLNHYKLYKIHNGFELDKYFNIQIDEATKKEISDIANVFCLPFSTNNISEKIIYGFELNYKKRHKPLNSQIIQKEFNSYDDYIFERINKGENLYLSGEWQNWNYYKEIEDELRKRFIFKTNFIKDNKEKIEEISNSNSVSIHLRRGDFVNNPLYDLCEKNYYSKAISMIEEKMDKELPKYYIFSDDIEYAKKFFSNIDAIYISSSSSIEDMQLMSLCRHHIIANSTFSFWAAFLGETNPEKNIVIAPKFFLRNKDKYMEFKTPERWLKINNKVFQ